MRNLLSTWLLFFTVFASTIAWGGECLVTRSAGSSSDEGSLLWALQQAESHRCGSDEERYRTKYHHFSRGASRFQVIHWASSLEHKITSSFPELRSYGGVPLLLVADDDAVVRFRGADGIRGPRLVGSSVIIDHLEFFAFDGAGVELDGFHHALLRSKIKGHRGPGVRIRGEGHVVLDNEIADNARAGIHVVSNPSSEVCTPPARASGTTIAANDIHHNETGVLIEAPGVRVVEWPQAEYPFGDRALYAQELTASREWGGFIHDNQSHGLFVESGTLFKRCQASGTFNPQLLVTARISKTLFSGNGKEAINISHSPFPSTAELAVSGTSARPTKTIAGLIQLPNDSALPWSSRTIDLTSLEVQLFALHPSGPMGLIGGTEDVDASGRFSIEVPETTIAGRLVATVTSRAYNVTSPFSRAAASDGDAADSDGDGLPDAREDFNANGVHDAEAGETDPLNFDTDGDGINDGEERGRRLDPNRADSDGDCLPDGVELGVSESIAQSLIGRYHHRPHLQWPEKCRRIFETRGVASFENAIPFGPDEPKNMENISLLFDSDPKMTTDPLLKDSDGDGLSDGQEDWNADGKRNQDTQGKWLETDPLLKDSDADGLPDGDEENALRPDSDGDGVLDGDELRLGTDPKNCDTDGDGLSDGVEQGIISTGEGSCHGLFAAGTNYARSGAMDPLNKDSDGDGLRDGEEDRDGNGWIDIDETDPSLPDSDRDSIDDGIEAKADFDGDGFPDFDIRTMTGGAGCSPPKSVEDLDCDGVPNARDDDSDNDGCPDRQEGERRDQNNNGIPDLFDAAAKECGSKSASSAGGPSGGGGGGAVPPASEKPKPLPAWVNNLSLAGGSCSLGGWTENLRAAPLFFSLFLFLMVFPLVIVRNHDNDSACSRAHRKRASKQL